MPSRQFLTYLTHPVYNYRLCHAYHSLKVQCVKFDNGAKTVSTTIDQGSSRNVG